MTLRGRIDQESRAGLRGYPVMPDEGMVRPLLAILFRSAQPRLLRSSPLKVARSPGLPGHDRSKDRSPGG